MFTIAFIKRQILTMFLELMKLLELCVSIALDFFCNLITLCNMCINLLFDTNFHILMLFSDDHGFSLLHWAAKEGHYNISETLVHRGARVNATNIGDDTPLHLASAHGHRDIVHLVWFCFIFTSMPSRYNY